MNHQKIPNLEDVEVPLLWKSLKLLKVKFRFRFGSNRFTLRNSSSKLGSLSKFRLSLKSSIALSNIRSRLHMICFFEQNSWRFILSPSRPCISSRIRPNRSTLSLYFTRLSHQNHKNGSLLGAKISCRKILILLPGVGNGTILFCFKKKRKEIIFLFSQRKYKKNNPFFQPKFFLPTPADYRNFIVRNFQSIIYKK